MKMWRSLFALTACSTAGPSLAQITHMEGGPRVNQLNLHNGVTPIAQDIAWLHWMMLIICTIIFIGVLPPASMSTWVWKWPGPSSLS